MDWLQQVVPNPWFPNLTVSVLIWTIPFAVACLYFLRLSTNSWRAYRYQIDVLMQAERLFALGRLVSYIDSLIIVIAGLVVGLLAASAPHTTTHFDLRTLGITIALLIIPVGKLLQGFLMKFIFDRAGEALRAESYQKLEIEVDSGA